MNWSYLFKHWFGTLFLAPFVFELFCIISESSKNIVGLVEVYPITFIFSLIFSTPTYILYGIIYYYLAKKEIAINYSKAILILLTSLCILITFEIVFNGREIPICNSYVISSIITGILFKLNFKNDNHKSNH